MRNTLLIAVMSCLMGPGFCRPTDAQTRPVVFPPSAGKEIKKPVTTTTLRLPTQSAD